MKFFSIYTPAKGGDRPPTEEERAAMDQLMAESKKAGTLLATGGLLPASKGGARIRMSDGKITVVDGPFTEAKEVIAGFAVIQAKSQEEAIKMTENFMKMVGADGECELRQILDPDEDFSKL